MKNISYITLDVVLAIHDDMIEKYGGSHGIRDLGLIQSAIARPQSSFGGEDLYKDIFDKAAALFYPLMFNHAFVDGNKRTTIVSTARFLSMNGYDLDVSQKELVVFPLRVENKHLSIEEISKWLERHSKKNS
ncbi:MAG: type II toxin-antitoxin system death-on-curing family toxin [Candidatus Levybacteria bacterium]|nr:type II toxin-antitoxin system death-on-curing family toxin [Candidatus Levybacteria bacterium]MBI2420727.1 type II toxin-antitoxin system death-on-curing family toxin [Candidatus Levybacteria bacterium]MBI4097584.1 type II toxin-antitoxin system death-on-curing family toxin [Candidatus Levybacteria bacterium]